VRVFVTGGSGFVGRALVAALAARGDQPVALTRSATRARARLPDGIELVEGDPTGPGDWQKALRGTDAVINLAGESLGAQRWNAQIKQQIHDSRVESTRFVVEGIASLADDDRPRVLVSASGIDYYPFSLDLGRATKWDEDDEVDERVPRGDHFLGRVCANWEAEARQALALGCRVVLMRSAIVLGHGGPLEVMSKPFRYFVGGRLGSGNQWMCWIHLDDAVRGYLFALDTPALSGPVNLTSPNPVHNRDFAKSLGRHLHRPSIMPAPGFAVRAVAGEFADYILNGRRAVPRALGDAGFTFDHPELDPALDAALAETRSS